MNALSRLPRHERRHFAYAVLARSVTYGAVATWLTLRGVR